MGRYEALQRDNVELLKHIVLLRAQLTTRIEALELGAMAAKRRYEGLRVLRERSRDAGIEFARLQGQMQCGITGHKFLYDGESLGRMHRFECKLCRARYARHADKLTSAERSAVDAVFTPGEAEQVTRCERTLHYYKRTGNGDELRCEYCGLINANRDEEG